MNAEEYLKDPCGASSLPFWKTERVGIPENMAVIRDDRYRAEPIKGRDEPYFKLMHRLGEIDRPVFPPGFQLTACDFSVIAAHINACYTEERVTPEELAAYAQRPVYDPGLWIAVRDMATLRLAATGIAELDARIGEGILEWVQVSPEYRRQGLGRFVVCQLLALLREKARFATVSGRVNNPSQPMALYLSCGFENPVIWHVVTVNKPKRLSI